MRLVLLLKTRFKETFFKTNSALKNDLKFLAVNHHDAEIFLLTENSILTVKFLPVDFVL